MKGLLLKDWYVALKYCRLHFAIVIFMSVLSVFVDTGMVYLLYPMLFAGVIPVYVLSVDEKQGWNAYAQTLPVPRRALVTAKYIDVLAVLGGALLLMGVLWTIKARLSPDAGYEVPQMLGLLLCAGLVFPTLTLPAMLRFGVEKGRYIMMAGVAVLAAIIAGALFSSDKAPLPGGSLGVPGNLIPMLICGMLALFVLSWFIACKLYEKREL